MTHTSSCSAKAWVGGLEGGTGPPPPPFNAKAFRVCAALRANNANALVMMLSIQSIKMF
jgi:hypothetical protein